MCQQLKFMSTSSLPSNYGKQIHTYCFITRKFFHILYHPIYSQYKLIVPTNHPINPINPN